MIEKIARFVKRDSCNNKTVIGKAAKWMRIMLKKSADYENLSLYARLLFKTGKKQQSLATMQKAITEGKKKKEDTSAEEKWIRQYFPQPS